jgi:Leucine rich repeat
MILVIFPGLKYTNITNLEYGTFSHLPDLTNLDISYNSLKKIDLNIFTSLTSLEKLALDGNDLTEISYEDIKHTFPKLKSISLSENNWNCTYLTTMIKKMTSGGVEIKIDPAKFVRNSTNQKGIACRDTKNEELKHWRAPLLKFDATVDGFNATAYTEEMSKTIDKLIASINTTDVESLKEQVSQLKGRLEYLEKKLTDQEMNLVKTQLQISTANSTQQTQSLGHIHTLIDQLNNLTLQRQQLNNDVLSQKIYELNYNMDRNVKNLERLEAMVKAKDSSVDVENSFRVRQAALNDVKSEQSSMVVVNVVAILIMIIVVMYCGFKVMIYYKSRQKRRLSAFSNGTSMGTLEHSI